MKILITGANGFIGKYLANKFGNDCIATNRETLNLLEMQSVINFFSTHDTFDAIIHCAVKGGRRIIKYGPEILEENITAFENLVSYINRTKIFVSYSSGAEFSTDETDYYGISKRIITDKLLKYSNAVNIRIYNCFGEEEESQRYIKTCVRNCLQNKDITIFQNKYMDFFYIDDLYTLTKDIIISEKKIGEIDSVYSEKMTLENVANYIKKLTNSNSNIIIEKEGMNTPYIGDGTLLSSLNLPLIGFNDGIINVIKHMEQEVL